MTRKDFIYEMEKRDNRIILILQQALEEVEYSKPLEAEKKIKTAMKMLED